MSTFKMLSLIFAAILLLPLTLWMLGTNDIHIQQAEESYRQGESAKTLFARQQAFNSALATFLKLEADHHPHFGTGKLHLNIGNTYFQLGEYPSAILYYKRAENLMPRSPLVKRNLAQARHKMGLEAVEDKHRLLDNVLLRPFLSLPERLQLFFVLALMALIFTSCRLWKGGAWLSKMAAFFIVIAGFFLLNLGLTYYFSPVEAVLIHAAEMRKDAGVGYAKVGDKPIPGGTVLEVIGSSPNGQWLKVMAPNGEFGYLSGDALKLVDL